MGVSEYFTIVAITVSMVMGALVLFFGSRSKGPYHAGWTDAPLNRNYKMVTFNGGMMTFTGGGCS